MAAGGTLNVNFSHRMELLHGTPGYLSGIPAYVQNPDFGCTCAPEYCRLSKKILGVS